MIETLVVDLGGVAARFHPGRRLQALAAVSGLPPEVIQARIFDSGFEHDAELGKFTPEETLARMLGALDQRLSEDALVLAWSQAFQPDEEVLGMLAPLSVRTVMLTNNGPMLDACLEGPLPRLKAAFREIICSWHLGATKPDRLAFERAAARLSCRPDQLLLLDDSVINVAAAVDLGWQAKRIESLSDLAAALAEYPERAKG